MGDRHCAQVDGVGVQGADVGAGPDRVQVVVVGAWDEFGQAGGAAGELEEGDGAGVGVGQGGPFRFVPQCFQGGEPVRVLARVACHEYVFQARAFRTHPVGHGSTVEPGVGVGGDQGDRLGGAGQVDEFAVAVGGQCVHR